MPSLFFRRTIVPSTLMVLCLLLIAALTGCGGTVFNSSFTLGAPASVTVIQGSTSTAQITVIAQNGLVGGVNLTASGLPSGVTATFSPDTSAGSSAFTLTLNASGTAATGTSTISIRGTSGALSASAAIALTVNPVIVPQPPTISSFMAAPASITVGGSTMLTWSSTNATSCTASGGWTGPEAVSGTASVSPLSTTIYTLTCAGSSGTSVPASVTVTVNPLAVLPTISIFSATPSTITSGSSSSLLAAFTGGAGVITPGNLVVTSGTAVSVSPTATTTYTLTVTPTSGTAVTQTVTVTVSPTPVISVFSATPATIASGSSSSLLATFTSGTGMITPGNLAVTSGTAVSVSPTATTTYTLTVTPTTGTAVTQTVTVTVSPTPAISVFSATPSTIASGSSSSLLATFTGGTGVVTPGNLAVTSGTAVSVSPTATTTYTLTIIPTTGTRVTQTVTVTVGPTPVISIFSATPATITSGSSSSLLATFTGGAGVITPGNLVVTSGAAVSVSPTATTVYTLTVTPTTGTAVTQTATVTVTPFVTTPSITSFTAASPTITAGASTTLMAVFTGGTGVITPGNTPATSGIAVSVSPSATTIYTLTVTPTTGTAITQAITVTVTPSTSTACTGLPAPGSWDTASVSPVTYPGVSPQPNVDAAFTGDSMSIVVDPFVSSTVWLGTGNMGLYKSTDCGAPGTWVKVNTGTNGDVLDQGSIWSMAVDPSNQGVIYAPIAYDVEQPGGMMKSTDGGVDWVQLFSPTSQFAQGPAGNFVNNVSMDANKTSHIVVESHGPNNGPGLIAESFDGGTTWPNIVSMPDNWAEKAGVQVINATTWIWGDDSGSGSLYVTTDNGQTWLTPELANNHPGFGLFPSGEFSILPLKPAADGAYYSTTGIGVIRSTDGVNWTLAWPEIDFGYANTSGIVVTPTTIYAGSDSGATLYSAPLSNPSNWSVMSGLPSGFAPNGATSFLAYDGDHGILYVSTWQGGVWRYMVPTSTTTPPPSITSFTANPTSITSGTSSSLTAVFTGGTGVITPGNIPATSGTAVTVSPIITTTYTLTVTPTTGTAVTQLVTVTVTPAPTITSFTATPATITSGSSSSLLATFTGGTGAITPGNLAITSGTAVSVSPTATTIYTLTVTPTTGTAVTQTVTVTVAPAGAQFFTLGAAPASVSVTNGTSQTSTINVTGQNGFTGSVSLVATGLPSGVTTSFNPTSATTVTPSVLTFNVGSSTTAGTYTVTVTGTSGSLTAFTTITLVISATQATPSFLLQAQSYGVIYAQGTSGVTTVGIDDQNGFTGSVNLAVSGLPSGVTATLSPSSTATGSTITFNISSTAPQGAYTATVTGTAGNMTSTASFTLAVVPAIANGSLAGCPTSSSPGQVGVWQNITPAAFIVDPTLQTTSVSVDPLNSGVLYASAGSKTNGGPNGGGSVGVYKSTDCGSTWNKISTPGSALETGDVWELQVNSSSPQMIFADNGYGSNPTLYRSENGGVTWTAMVTDVNHVLMYNFVRAFAVDPTHPLHVLVSYHEVCGAPLTSLCLGETTDGGNTWRQFSVTPINAQDEDGGGPYIIGPDSLFYSDPASGLWHSADDGATWILQIGSYQTTAPVTYGPPGDPYLASNGDIFVGFGGTGTFEVPSGSPIQPSSWTLLNNSAQASDYIDDGTTLYSAAGVFPMPPTQLYSTAPLSALNTWTPMTSTAMSRTGELSYDTGHHIIYSANWSSGLWRLITQASTSTTPPTITGFTATSTSITSGASTSLTATFTGGTGVITPGNITVTSGTAVSVSPTTTTTYTLTVTPTTGTSVTQTVTVTVTASGGTTITSLLGKPNRVLIGLGSLSEPNYATDLQGQDVAANVVQNPDIVDQYLPDFGYSSSTPNYWVNYDPPPGTYALDVAQDADAIGAVPMFTLYQMAQAGDGNISWIDTQSQMDIYWSHARILFQMINKFGKPALVNLEPDFWGYVELQAPNGDPTQMAASVNDQAECAALPNNVTGLAACILVLGRTYAPNALIGFQPSFFGETAPQLANFMNLLGAQHADFTVAETLDRDAGCYEEAVIQKTDTATIHAATTCTRTGTFYLDETNTTSPNFNEEIGQWATYRDDLDTKLPVIWWQTPMGVPSTTPGGVDGQYRDDHVDYMFKNMAQYADMGTFGIVYSGGASYQTGITTDGGEFATDFNQYLSAGGVAPVY
jgi:hypothetical protein